MSFRSDALEDQIKRAIGATQELREAARRVALEADKLRFTRLYAANLNSLSPAELRRISRDSDEAVHLLGLAAHVSKHVLAMARRIEREAEGREEV
jgi:hypothetical protein